MKKEFVRVRSVKDIAVFASLIILGSILIVLPTGAGINITGFFLIFAGLILSLVLRTSFKDIETGEKFNKNEHYFQHDMKADILAALRKDPSYINMSDADKGNGLKIDIYYSKSLAKAYVQVFEYIPYKYQPCSEVFEYETSKVNKLI